MVLTAKRWAVGTRQRAASPCSSRSRTVKIVGPARSAAASQLERADLVNNHQMWVGARGRFEGAASQGEAIRQEGKLAYLLYSARPQPGQRCRTSGSQINYVISYAVVGLEDGRRQ